MVARMLGASILLCMADVLHSFAIEEKGDVYNRMACPAFLMFVNTAYLAGMTFELPCRCKPKEVSSVVWYFQKNMENHKPTILTDLAGTRVVDSGHIRVGSNLLKRFSIRMFSLIIFHSQESDSGHYLCGTDKGDFFYGYDVDVQPTKHIRVAFMDKDEHIQDDSTAKDFNLFTTFWDWTRCDRCGVRGEQRRIGLCYMQSPWLHPRYRTAMPNVTSCGSNAVPAHLQKPGHLRRPEIAIRSCLTPCQEKKVHKEGIQGISDVISKLSQKPWLSRIPTQFHRQLLGGDLVITCPGARPEHAVAWDKESVRLYLSHYLIGVNKTMRIFIDHGNHLHIQQIKVNDEGTYFCWREGKLVAAFRLRVIKWHQHWRTFNDPETIYAIKNIGLSYLIISALFIVIHVCRQCWRASRCLTRV
ncbi:F187A protein, partial [Geococcyx californianus]|nr:F187A protein [Geococcyx californianus]